MLILLDESVPRRLSRELPGYEVRTVQQQGWSGYENGALLARAESAGFAALITADQNLQYQQNLSGLKIRVIVLAATSNRFEVLRQLGPQIITALEEMEPGQVRVIRPMSQ